MHRVVYEAVEVVLKLDVLIVFEHDLLLARLYRNFYLLLPEGGLDCGDHIKKELFIDALGTRLQLRVPIG